MKQITLLLLMVFICSCKNKAVKTDYLGIIDFEVTGTKDAIPKFEKGLLLLHSFEYQDAREAFLEAQKLDPNMAMAYWGEAMTYNHSLWRDQDFDNAIETVQKIKKLREKVEFTTVEEGLLDGVEILYKEKTLKKERDQAYMKHMQELFKKFPENNEIAAFYSLSLLGSVAEGRNDSIYGEGAVIANKILQSNRKHPGALHYLIHSYDDPKHAHLALDAADAYAKVAPDASHALHMPSHIYVALGMWDKVVASNIDSYGASVARMKNKELDNNARGYHAYHWLEYGYLQKGQVAEAEKMVWDMEKYCKEDPSRRARVHLLFLKGTFLAEADLWNHPISNIEIDVSDANIAIKSQNYFIEGRIAFENNNAEVLGKIIESMESDIKSESLLVDNVSSGFSVCASGNRELPNRTDISESIVMKTQLMALRARLENNIIETEKFLKKSVFLQDQLAYSYGPPFIQKPTKEMYAEFLMDQNRLEESIVLFKQALEKGTKRLTALNGLEKATLMLEKKMSVKEAVL
ncbi:hypothetical protein [uncultured Algibacter sp.]|uniref:tetratricopeptide repeat protein n=1 Tax=uncultured Algibacter sp. TaxID=298659 RepID=UPI0026312FAD|nr:hypothetical protein [uncultured Algibacter sp.]